MSLFVDSEAECKATLGEMNQQMKILDPRFDLYDVKTYEHAPITNNFGLYAKRPIFTPAFLNNRQNPGLVKIFALLLGCSSGASEMLVNHDRCAFYRPTLPIISSESSGGADGGFSGENIAEINGEIKSREEWKTAYTFPRSALRFSSLFLL